MSKIVTLVIQIDSALKQEAERLLRNMGLTSSQAITLFYEQIIFQQAMPFQTSLPNKETLQAMNDLEKRRDIKTFNDVDALLKDLQEDS